MRLHTAPRALLLGFLLLTATQAARAQDDWRASAYKGWSVTSVDIRGLDKDSAAELKRGLALDQRSGILKGNRPIFFPQTLNEDIQRTRFFLARRGYPHARIVTSFSPDAKRERLVVTMEIHSGPAVKIEAIAIRGVPTELEERAKDMVGIDPGDVFFDDRIDEASVALDSLLTYSGYARAAVESRVEWNDSTRVSVYFDVTPGTIYYFGQIDVTGAPDDLVALIHKSSALRSGQRYSPERAANAQRNLRILGLFRQVRLDFEDSGTDTLDVVIDIVMRETRSFETTARFWTDDGFSGDARWTHRNLLKRGRGVSVVVFGSVLRQIAQVSAWWPAIWWPLSRGIVTVGTTRENEDAYRSVSTGIWTSLRHEYSRTTFISGGISLTNEDITNKSADLGAIPDEQGRLFAFNFTWDRFDGDDLIVATRGTVWRGFAEWAPQGNISEAHYILGQMTGIVYVPFLPRSGFAARLTVGLGQPLSPSTGILPNKLFYAGGSNSMRGFDRRKLGPLDSAGAPLGGESMMEASLEYRFPLLWRLKGTLFVDSGQVWSEHPDLDERRVEVAVGPGLWLGTPIGPIRTDIGYRITDYEKSQPRWVFHFSIGPAF